MRKMSHNEMHDLSGGVLFGSFWCDLAAGMATLTGFAACLLLVGIAAADSLAATEPLHLAPPYL